MFLSDHPYKHALNSYFRESFLKIPILQFPNTIAALLITTTIISKNVRLVYILVYIYSYFNKKNYLKI